MTHVLLRGSWPLNIIKQPQEKFAILSKLYPITLCRRLTVNGTHSNIYGLHTGSRFPQKMDPRSPCSRVSESFDSMFWTCLVSIYRVSVWDDHGTQVCVPLWDANHWFLTLFSLKSSASNIFGYTWNQSLDWIETKFFKKLVKKLLYFEWSPPWHVGWRLSGEGCHWEYDGKNGEFENIDFRFPWLSDTSEMGFGHDVPFLNYSDRLPHPSDLCQPDRVRWG